MNDCVFRKGLVVGIIFLFIGTCLTTTICASTSKIGLNIKDENDAEAPIWNVGHSWTYDVTINGGKPPNLNINNLKMDDLTFTVEQVYNDSYILSFSAGLTGSGNVKISIITLSGQLQNTVMQGKIIVNKSKLTINEVQDLIVDGYVKPNFLPKIPFTVEGDGLLTYGIPLLNFPINNYDSWFIDKIIMVFNLNVNLLPDPLHETVYVEGHYAECHRFVPFFRCFLRWSHALS